MAQCRHLLILRQFLRHTPNLLTKEIDKDAQKHERRNNTRTNVKRTLIPRLLHKRNRAKRDTKANEPSKRTDEHKRGIDTLRISIHAVNKARNDDADETKVLDIERNGDARPAPICRRLSRHTVDDGRDKDSQQRDNQSKKSVFRLTNAIIPLTHRLDDQIAEVTAEEGDGHSGGDLAGEDVAEHVEVPEVGGLDEDAGEEGGHEDVDSQGSRVDEDEPEDVGEPDDLEHLLPAAYGFGPVRVAFPGEHVFEEAAGRVVDGVERALGVCCDGDEGAVFFDALAVWGALVFA
jgi:hypothetical protein